MVHEETMQDMKGYIKTLKKSLADIKKYATEILDCLNQNQFVSKELSDSMRACLELHEKEQIECKKLYKAIFKKQIELDGIAALENAISKLEESQEQQKLVDKFLRLSSDDASVVGLLKIEKDKLLDLVVKFGEDIEKLRVETEHHRKFADYIENIDLLSDGEKMIAMMEMQPVFGSDLTMQAFAFKKIYITDSIEGNLRAIECETVLQESSVSEEGIKSTSDGSNAADFRKLPLVSTEEAAMKEKAIDASDGTVAEEDIKPGISEKKTTESNELSKLLSEAIQKYGALYPEDFNFGSLSCDKSSRELKKCGAKEFKNDINSGSYPKMEKKILHDIYKYSYMRAETIQMFHTSMKKDAVEASLCHLLSRGFVRKYSLTGFGEFYCETVKSSRALQSQAVKNFIGLRGYHSDASDELIEDRASSACVRFMYMSLMEYEQNNHFKADKYTASNFIQADVFVTKYKLLKNDKVDCDVVIGSAMKSLDEIDILTENMNNLTRALEGSITRLIFGGYNLEYAEKSAYALLSVFEKLSSVEQIYLYDAIHDDFYKLGEKEVISIEQIWIEKDRVQENLSTDDWKETEKSTETVIAQIEEDVDMESKSNSDEIVKANDTSVGVEKNEKLEIKKDQISCNTITEPVSVQKKVKIDDTDPMEAVNLSDDDIETMKETACQMIVDGNTYCATVYLASFGNLSRRAYALYDKLAYAVNDPLMRISYSANNMYDSFFDEDTRWHDYLAAATMLRTFFYNHVQYDFTMPSLYDSTIHSISVIKECTPVSQLLHELNEFRKKYNKGIDAYADYRMKEKMELEAYLSKLRREAKELYAGLIENVSQERTSMHRFIETKKLIFDKENDIPVYMKAICDGNIKFNEMAIEFVKETFIRNERPMEIANIDPNKIEDYMDNYWNQAAEKVRVKKHSSQLMGSLRQNLYSAIYKSVSIICNWLIYSEMLDNNSDDAGLIACRSLKNKLLGYINSGMEYFGEELDDVGVEENAGRVVIYDTLLELKERLEGTYVEGSNKYFYMPFLTSDLVLLDDEYLPEIEMCYQDVEELSITNRILEHSQTRVSSYTKRLNDIFKEYGDDFGSAKLILEYLKETKAEVTEEEYDLEETIRYAEGGFHRSKEKFEEDLELMQSYGQIDTASGENAKEKILQIVTDAYDKASKSKNFGFFRRVTEAYKKQIKEASKVREDSLKKQLEEFRAEAIKAENKQELDRVQKMLDIQNYTVAEDLLSRYKNSELDDTLEILPKDYLQIFLNQYDYYRNKVAKSDKKLSALISTRMHNKDEKGAQRMIDNWIVSTGHTSVERIQNLFQSFGFRVASVREHDKIDNMNNFIIKLAKPANGRKANFKHPIAVFGSKACEDGFRVVTIFGRTDADRLIAAIRNMGGSKDTIILLDYALDLPDRRKLARKLKGESFGKTFAIIDRVVIHFLMDTYNTEYVNQILMSIIMPFSFGQPYVWDSVNVMPPEIFMGRSEELEKIESPTGVNIVYGGRQLGKSALLKMAKNDIDHDEYGNRAVLVEIKDLDYKKAAKKIGHALYDNDVLDQDIDTEDWDDLARAIKNRLIQERNKIPYLLLLLDEADVFIASCKEINYHPFDALKEIQGIGTDRFKFVIAGLRSIVKFNREVALGNNSVITHLQDLTVRPFNYKEARELLEIPLYYLGLRFSEEKDYLISSIFANANYFPGLIQLYCAKLVEAMKKGNYAGYNEADSPIYEVHEDHIKKVLGEDGFREQIREKFEITLKLDEDNFYYIIALLIAKLYHENGYTNGYTALNILDAGDTYGIEKVKNLTEDKMEAFLQELCDLNVLRRNSDDRYLFNRHNFFQMMGNEHEVDEKLLECMEE